MVLQVLPDAAQIDSDGNVESPQVFRGTDPRQHQQLRRSERSCREQDLVAALQSVSLTTPNIFYSHCPPMIEQDPVHLRSCHHAQSGI